MARPSRHIRALATVSVAALALGLSPIVTSTTAQATDSAFAPRLVTVDTPTRGAKQRLQALGLDLTEHAGHDYVEVVLHTGSDAAALQAAGLTYDVRIGNLLEREARNNLPTRVEPCN